SGKTNLVCNLANRLLADGYPCVFILGSLPVSHRMDLVAEVLRALGLSPGSGERTQIAVANLREALDAMPSAPLCILIDAINETRDVEQMREALGELFAHLEPLRIRILVTCRDIYWSFLNGDWVSVVDSTVRS